MNQPILRTYALGELAANCYLVACPVTRMAAVIDPGGRTSQVEEDLASLGLSLKAILATHGHADHLAGLEGIHERTGASIAVHRLDVEMLENPSLNLSAFFGQALRLPRSDISLDDGSAVTVGELTFRVIHTPGHTPGSVCYLLDGLLFSGDTLFREGVGRWDLPGGDGVQLQRSILQRLLPLDDSVRVYPGHGPDTTIGYERRHNPYLRQPESFFSS